jgi:hypothetical protein
MNLPARIPTCQSLLARSNISGAVNLTLSEVHDARGVALAGIGETVLDLAEPLLTAATAADHFTQVQFETVKSFRQQFGFPQPNCDHVSPQ